MANGQISREAIESLPRNKRRAQPSTTVDTFVEPQAALNQPTKSARVVSGLMAFSGQAIDSSVRSEKAKIDLDKVTQQQRALQGLDPTDDATNAGIRSYQVINMRDQVLETNSELAKTVQENPGMTDDEYAVATRDAYSGLISQYQPDDQLSKALSNRLQESQVQLHQIRTAAQKGHQAWLRTDALGSSIEEYREAAGSIEELSQTIGEDGSLSAEADALGVTPEEFRNTIVNAAKRDAVVGDGRILSAIEGQEWASSDPRVAQAREIYKRKEAQKNAVKIGSIRGDIEMSWKTRQASWEQTEAALDNLNERYPGSVSAAMVSSLKQQQASIAAGEEKKTQVQIDIMQNLTDPDSMRVGLRSDLTNKEVRDGVAGVSQGVDEYTAQLVETGELDQTEAYGYAVERKLEISRASGVEIPEFKRIFSSLSSLDPADFQNEDGVPDWANQALKTLPKLNESDIELYGANSKTRAFINNYNAMRDTEEPDPRAWRRAWAATHGETNLTPEQQATGISDARDAADDALDRSPLEWGTAWFTGSEAAPDHIRNWVATEASREASVLMGSGATDPDSVGAAAAERTLGNFTRLTSGSAINRSRSRILAEATDADGQSLIRSDELDQAFEWFVGSNLEQMDENSALDDLSMQDIKFTARPGGLIMPVDKLGSPLLDRPVTMRELGTGYREAVDTKRVEEALGTFKLRNKIGEAKLKAFREQFQ